MDIAIWYFILNTICIEFNLTHWYQGQLSVRSEEEEAEEGQDGRPRYLKFLFGSKMNGWTLVWGVPLHLFESFSHPRFSLSLHLHSNGVRCQISIFLVLLFVFCLVGQTLAPVGGLSVLMGGSQVPLILCLFVSYTRPPTPTPTHMS